MFSFKAQKMPLIYDRKVVKKYLTRCGKEKKKKKKNKKIFKETNNKQK